MKSRNSRPVNARRVFIDAVTDEAKALAKDYDHEVAKGFWPYLSTALRMLASDVEKARKKANGCGNCGGSFREAAE